jgi:hypothetical protein
LSQVQNTRLISKSAKSKRNFQNREKEQKETPKTKTIKKKPTKMRCTAAAAEKRGERENGREGTATRRE